MLDIVRSEVMPTALWNVDTPVTFNIASVGLDSVTIVAVATPAAPSVAITFTSPPLKSIVETLPAVPTTTPSSLIVNPPIAPRPLAVIPVKAEPSPAKAVAVTVPPLKVNDPESSNSPAVPATTTRPDVRSDTFAVAATKPTPPDIFAPLFASIASLNVETPAVTTNPPELILTPVLAVTIPMESMLVLSSLVNVPPTVTLPVNVASPIIDKVEPSKVRLVLSSNSPPVPATTTRLSVKSLTLAVPKTAPAAVTIPLKFKLENSEVPPVLIPGIDTVNAVPSPLKVPFRVVPSNVKFELS